MFEVEVTVRRPSTRSLALGDDVPDWDAAATHTISAAVAPAGSTEPPDGRSAITDERDLWSTNPTLDIEPRDRVDIGGDEFDVVGEPQRWPLGTKVALRRVLG